MDWRKKRAGFALIVLILLALAGAAGAVQEAVLSKGQTIYVPVYSNIFTAPKEIPVGLANVLNIRNTDLSNTIRVTTVDYYDSKGKLLRRHYKSPVILGALESTYIYLPERDQKGGIGANFIVKWEADKEVNAPIVECVNAGDPGRAFLSPGRVIDEATK